jgi:hypothetical protein
MKRVLFGPIAEQTANIGDDIIRDYMFSFIDSVNREIKPFLYLLGTNLVHEPFCPTPDDPEFGFMDSQQESNTADTVFFPSMVYNIMINL